MNTYIFILLLISSFTFAVDEGTHLKKNINHNYTTDDDGLIRLSVNILGHVAIPGAYMAYDGIDFLSVLSMAGGYLSGANLKKISVYHADGTLSIINLEKELKTNNLSNIKIKPFDTIIIDQLISSKIFTSSNLPSIILSFLNIALTIDRTD